MSATYDAYGPWYDALMERTLGPFIRRLTRLNLGLIEQVCPEPCRVLDIGAGTGRVAIELAARGYDVHAIEPSSGMLEVLERRAAEAGVSVKAQQAVAQTFTPVPQVRLAFAFFSVLSYVTDEADLREVVRRVHQSLEPGGDFLLELTPREKVRDERFQTDDIVREITVTQVGPGLYQMNESTHGTIDGMDVHVEAQHLSRTWLPGEVLRLLRAEGFTKVKNWSVEMAGAAGYYLQFAKA